MTRSPGKNGSLITKMPFLPYSDQIPTIPLRSAQNVWGSVKYSRSMAYFIELASGKRFTSILVKKFLENIDGFIESKYFPDSVEFKSKDPHNMSKDNIISLCNHICHHQSEHVADDIIRFHAYYNGKEMVATEYGREVNVEIAADRVRKQKASRKAGKKKSKKDPPIPQLPMPWPNTVNLLAINPALTGDGGHIIDKNQIEKISTDINQGRDPIQPNSTISNDNQNRPTMKPWHSRKCYDFLSLFLFSHHCSITPFHFPFELSFISHA